jgi:hypothetical protein
MWNTAHNGGFADSLLLDYTYGGKLDNISYLQKMEHENNRNQLKQNTCIYQAVRFLTECSDAAMLQL